MVGVVSTPAAGRSQCVAIAASSHHRRAAWAAAWLLPRRRPLPLPRSCMRIRTRSLFCTLLACCSCLCLGRPPVFPLLVSSPCFLFLASSSLLLVCSVGAARAPASLNKAAMLQPPAARHYGSLILRAPPPPHEDYHWLRAPSRGCHSACGWRAGGGRGGGADGAGRARQQKVVRRLATTRVVLVATSTTALPCGGGTRKRASTQASHRPPRPTVTTASTCKVCVCTVVLQAVLVPATYSSTTHARP